METFSEQGKLTSPGRHASALDALPDYVASLMAAVRGLFVHGDFLDIYGVGHSDFSSCSRETIALENRLDRVFRSSNQQLATPRPVNRREVGTCRDYALMACGMLRHKSVRARVRCGFARYFSPGRYEDHWICEYWRADDKRWGRADAQLDGAHCDHLGIAFNTCDLPDGEFVTANEAWELVRHKAVAANLFGHGEAAGEWFLWVNLARDCLSLHGQETSPWDSWRMAIGRKPEIDAADRAACDRIAEGIRLLEQQQDAAVLTPHLQPFWLARAGETKYSE